MNGRSIGAAVLVAFTAGPTVMAIMKVFQAFSFSYSPFWSSADLAGFLLSPFFGLVAGAPAAAVGAIVANILARHQLDASWLAILGGIVIGAAAATPFAFFSYHTDSIYIAVVFEIAAVLMSLLYWRLAIRPLRRRRMSTSR